MITTIVTAMIIAIVFCLIAALLLTRAERKQDWRHPLRPAAPDYADFDDEIAATMTAPRTIQVERKDEMITTIVTLVERVDRLQEDAKLTNRRLRNHAHRLSVCEDLVALLNELEQEAGADPELEHTQPHPAHEDVQFGLAHVNPLYAPTLYADAVREIARWRVEHEDGRLDLGV